MRRKRKKERKSSLLHQRRMEEWKCTLTTLERRKLSREEVHLSLRIYFYFIYNLKKCYREGEKERKGKVLNVEWQWKGIEQLTIGKKSCLSLFPFSLHLSVRNVILGKENVVIWKFVSPLTMIIRERRLGMRTISRTSSIRSNFKQFIGLPLDVIKWIDILR